MKKYVKTMQRILYVLIFAGMTFFAQSAQSQSSRLIGEWGMKPGQFQIPYGVAVDNDQHIYVADTGNNRIQIINEDLSLKITFGQKGSGDGQFLHPQYICRRYRESSDSKIAF